MATIVSRNLTGSPKTGAGMLRALAIAGVISGMGAACAPHPDLANAGRTAEEIQQLARLTDGAVWVMLRQLAVTIEAADNQLLAQAAGVAIENHVDAMAYTKARACVEASVVMFASTPAFMRRLEEAMRTGDDAAVEAHRESFPWHLSDLSTCYFLSVAYLRPFADLDAVNSLGVVIGEMYAITTILETLSGFPTHTQDLLKRHIEANMAIVARLAQRCEKSWFTDMRAPAANAGHPCASYKVAGDALPKLRAALSHIEANPIDEPPVDPCGALEGELKQSCQTARSSGREQPTE